MQETKDGQTRPVRIKEDLLSQLEQLAIKESANRGHLLTLGEYVDELLREAVKERLQ